MDDKKWMHLALEEAKKGYSEGEVPIGAVIVKDNTVVCSAHNRCRQLNDPSSHAECIAIKEAYEKLRELGFRTSNEDKVLHADEIKKMFEYIHALDDYRKGLLFNTDGMVIKINDRKIYRELGIVGKNSSRRCRV